MCVWSDPMLGGSGHVSDGLIAVVLGPVCGALLVAAVVFAVVKLHASRRRRRQQRVQHGNQHSDACLLSPANVVMSRRHIFSCSYVCLSGNGVLKKC